MLTKWISGEIGAHCKLMPPLVLGLVWLFFSGFRTILRAREDRLVRELLLCLSCSGFLFALLAFGCYGLVDPANGFARPGAAPVTPEALERFARMGYLSLVLGIVGGVALEMRLRARGESLRG